MDAHRAWTPLVITPAGTESGATPEGLIAHLRGLDDLADLLTRAKALVFRGFQVTPAELDEVMDLLLPNRLAYVHGNSPRTKVGQNVYTSTEYPPEYTISMHNEMSYAHHWPERLLFFCDRAAETGGATPVVDGVRWLEALDPEVRESFADGVRYSQNLHGGRGFGKSWQDTFETDSRAEVEAFLDGTGATYEWKNDGGLRVSQVRPSTATHPVTGTEVWFNQADQWHVAGLGDDTAAALYQIMPEKELPQSVSFADGSAIPPEYITQIRDRGLESAVDVDWRTGDLLLIDNMLVGHGRRPFTGPRRVLVAMSD
ncbi:TauD/TfdA family dioxygenase [Streptomyces antarcticus]|uniref:TauD/TfdA family dioxygenase n=1 Tax=Streptomyces antarcticus TaxID=2996458 RepID=UPI00226F14EC|nr:MULTISPECIES: TauD/TfdA family dioxygenase [unclassified Streptomyces]MCY0941370.1 TauD/TfdA family dioxygenase [Streptomyces sp. H34-AA3]MCZ4086070.1 TauD/TfdA family dioxygenase [Streptomyces sp. H34-S5]